MKTTAESVKMESGLTRGRKTGGAIMLGIGGLFVFFLIKVLLLTAPDQGKYTMLILFGGIAVPFILSGIYIFAGKKYFKKIIITFFICILATIIGSIASVAVDVRKHPEVYEQMKQEAEENKQ